MLLEDGNIFNWPVIDLLNPKLTMSAINLFVFWTIFLEIKV